MVGTLYVYAPVTGPVASCWDFGSPVTCPANLDGCGNSAQISNATGFYCSSQYTCGVCCHPSVTCSQPQDIDGSSGTAIYFIADPVVQSIYISYISNVCSVGSGCSGTAYSQGVNVYMYSGKAGGGVQLGLLSYGHVGSRAAAGYHDTYPNIYSGHSTFQLGVVLGGSCDDCFTGSHVHWEHCGTSTPNGSISCGDTMITDSSWVWQYTYP